ncbi:MAG: hypothetical protein ABI233_13265 [Chthoniobacterales bacterium]
MKLVSSLALLIALTFASVAVAKDPKPVEVSVPSGINHGSYEQLLEKYVNSR